MKKIFLVVITMFATSAFAQNTVIINGGSNITINQYNSGCEPKIKPTKPFVKLNAGLIGGGIYMANIPQYSGMNGVDLYNYGENKEQWKMIMGGYIGHFECMLSFSNGFDGVYCGYKAESGISAGLYGGRSYYRYCNMQYNFGAYLRVNLCKYFSLFGEYTTHGGFGVGATICL